MDPVSTCISITRIIFAINEAVKEVADNREECARLCERLTPFDVLLHHEKLSNPKVWTMVGALKVCVEEAHDFIRSFLPPKSRKKPKTMSGVVNHQVRQFGKYMESVAKRKEHGKKFLDLDARLSKFRDDFNAISAIVNRMDNDPRAMLDLVAKHFKNDFVREINKMHDEAIRGGSLPSDIDEFRAAPETVQRIVDELSSETGHTTVTIASPQLRQFVQHNVDQIITVSRMQRDKMAETLFPGDDEDIRELFELGSPLGEPGSFGVTYKATYQNDHRIYALKRVNVGRARQMKITEDLIEREADTLKRVTHSHIVRFYHSFFDEAGDYFYLIMELVLGRTLGFYINRNPPATLLLKWLQQLTSALVYLHGDCGIVHRDLKPANIMITEDMEDVKIIDFGLARTIANEKLNDMTVGVGTYQYMSHEKLDGLYYDGRDDVWAVGCIFVELILQQALKFTPAKRDVERHEKLLAVTRVNPALGRLVTVILADKLQERRPSSAELLVLVGEVNLSLQVVSPLHKEPDIVASELSMKPIADSVGTTTTASSSTTTTNLTSSGSGVERSSRSVPLEDLDGEAAVNLLVQLGCSVHLRQKVESRMEKLDGAFLREIDDIEVLYELEQVAKTPFENAHMRSVLKKLQEIQREGCISFDVYERVSKAQTTSERLPSVKGGVHTWNSLEATVQKLSNDSPSVRAQAVNQLIQTLSSATSATKQQASAAGTIPPLVAMLREADDDLRLQAMTAIRHVKDIDRELPQAKETDDTLTAIVSMLTSRSSAIRQQATMATMLMAREPVNKRTAVKAGAIGPLVRLLGDGDVTVRQNAAGALLNIAVNAENKVLVAEAGAIAPLVRLLGDGDVTVRQKAAGALWNIAVNAENKVLAAKAFAIAPLVRLLGDGDVTVRQNAAGTLSTIAVNAENKVLVAEAGAIAPLVRLLGDSDVTVRQQAAGTLLTIAVNAENKVLVAEAGAIAPLVRLLGDGDVTVRQKAAGALLTIADNAENKVLAAKAGAIAPLVQLLGDSDVTVRQQAVGTLSTIAVNADNKVLVAKAGAIAPLVRLLGDGDVTVRQNAAGALWNIADNAENKVLAAKAGAIPPLVRLLGDGDVTVRQKAAGALWTIAGNAMNRVLAAKAGAIAPLVQLLGDGDVIVRQKAAGALSTIVVNTDNKVLVAKAGAIAPLVQLLGDGDVTVRQQAAGALLNIADNAENKVLVAQAGAIAPLVQLLGDGDVEVRRKAEALLSKLKVRTCWCF